MQSDIVGDSFFDLVHPKDVSKIKEQLMCPETIPREQQTDNRSKTSLQTRNEVNQQPVKLCSGSRRLVALLLTLQLTTTTISTTITTTTICLHSQNLQDTK